MLDPKPLQAERDGGAWLAQTVETSEELEELHHPKPLGKWEVPGREADLLHRAASFAGQRTTDDLDRPGVGSDHAEQHEQRRRLAGTVGTEERDALAGADLEVDAVDGANALVLLDQPTRAQHGSARRLLRGPRHGKSVAPRRAIRPLVFTARTLGSTSSGPDHREAYCSPSRGRHRWQLMCSMG